MEAPVCCCSANKIIQRGTAWLQKVDILRMWYTRKQFSDSLRRRGVRLQCLGAGPTSSLLNTNGVKEVCGAVSYTRELQARRLVACHIPGGLRTSMRKEAQRYPPLPQTHTPLARCASFSLHLAARAVCGVRGQCSVSRGLSRLPRGHQHHQPRPRFRAFGRMPWSEIDSAAGFLLVLHGLGCRCAAVDDILDRDAQGRHRSRQCWGCWCGRGDPSKNTR